ncbi:MAG: AMP-binding protein [Rhizobiales bacterium]|nr:AMP-binding protein [Hyphomicrobiales bacterium]
MMSPEPLRLDLGSLLERQAGLFGDRRFVKMADDAEWVTYGAFNARANRIAHGLAELGVSAKTYVCILLGNSVDYLAFSYALKKIGAIEVSVNVEFKGVGLARLLNMTGARMIVTEQAFFEQLCDVQQMLEHADTLILADNTDPSDTPLSRYRRIALDDMISSNTTNPVRNVADFEVSQIQFTSGTTGPAKGLLSTHRHALRKAEGVAEVCKLTADDCSYTPWPLFHSGAAHHEVLTVILTGGRVVLRKRFSATRFWDEIRENGATWFMIVGSVEMILCAPPPDPRDADNPVRVVFGCPYPIPRKTFEARFGLKTIDCYGLEDAGFVSATHLDDGDYETQGRVRDLYEIRIGDENDDPVPVGAQGEILIRTREPYSIIQGYFGDPEGTIKATRNQWFHTGDLGKVDAAGRLYYISRLKQIIRRRGENIQPVQIEEVVHTHPDVEECVAVGVPSPVGEEDVKLLVALRPGRVLTADALRDFCDKRMARFMIPEHIIFSDEIPRTPTGKPDLAKIRDMPIESRSRSSRTV